MWNFVDSIVEYGTRSEPPEIFRALKARPSMEELFCPSPSNSQCTTPCDEEGDSFVESPEGEKATAATTKKKERQIKSKRSTDIKIDTKFIWSGPVQESAFLTGSFSDWGEHVQLEKSGEVYSTTLPLAPGLYTFKYIIDGKWTHDGRRRTTTDENNNINNVVSVGLKPVKFVWKWRGAEVGVSGSFCGWKQIISLVPTGDEKKVTVMIPPGEYEYKLIVDGVWMCDPSVPIRTEESGHVNNVLVV